MGPGPRYPHDQLPPGEEATVPIHHPHALRGLALSLGLALAGPLCTPGPYLSPVQAPVALGFHLPDGPYGAGNRGLEYVTELGQSVRAIGAGEVTFAGSVAGERHVSIAHGKGLVSSYSYLDSIAVRRGQPIAAGSLVGTTSARFQLGVRRDGVYIDPAPLLGGRLRPRLVGLDFPPPLRC